VKARFFTTFQTESGAHPISYTIFTWSSPGIKRPRRGVDHPSPSSPEIKPLLLWDFVVSSRVNFTFTTALYRRTNCSVRIE
jgi:hypothetical protein